MLLLLCSLRVDKRRVAHSPGFLAHALHACNVEVCSHSTTEPYRHMYRSLVSAKRSHAPANPRSYQHPPAIDHAPLTLPHRSPPPRPPLRRPPRPLPKPPRTRRATPWQTLSWHPCRSCWSAPKRPRRSTPSSHRQGLGKERGQGLGKGLLLLLACSCIAMHVRLEAPTSSEVTMHAACS